jgi:ABC-2 type transport system ATP-binding protein
LLLDEPLSHLDPLQRRRCVAILEEERRRGATVLFSTHILADLQEGPIRRVCFLREGRLLHECEATSDLQAVFQELHEKQGERR